LPSILFKGEGFIQREAARSRAWDTSQPRKRLRPREGQKVTDLKGERRGGKLNLLTLGQKDKNATATVPGGRERGKKASHRATPKEVFVEVEETRLAIQSKGLL